MPLAQWGTHSKVLLDAYPHQALLNAFRQTWWRRVHSGGAPCGTLHGVWFFNQCGVRCCAGQWKCWVATGCCEAVGVHQRRLTSVSWLFVGRWSQRVGLLGALALHLCAVPDPVCMHTWTHAQAGFSTPGPGASVPGGHADSCKTCPPELMQALPLLDVRRIGEVPARASGGEGVQRVRKS